MTVHNALTPVAGTNGYQQQIAIDPNEPLTLSVANASGRITILGSDQPNVWVVVRRTDDRPDDDEVGIAVSVEGNSISVRPEWQIASGLQGLAKRVKDQLQHGFNPDDWNISKLQLHPDLEYDIRVEIPREVQDGSRVQAKSASGRIDLSEVHADVTTASASGAVRLTNVDGKTSAHTASGSVNVTNVTGSLEVNTASGGIRVSGGEAWTALRTVSGSVKIEDVTLRNARIVTVSGSVSGDAIANNAIDYTVETVSGSVKLDLRVPASGATSRLNFKTLSGSARVDGDWIAEGKRNWRIGSGEDGPQVRVKTVSGSLKMTGQACTDVSLDAAHLPTPLERVDVDRDLATEPFGPGQADGDDQDLGKQVSANLDLDLNLDKAFAWAKETARKFTPPTPPTPPTPATPSTPATPVTPPAPPTPPDWSWSSGAGTPPPPGAANPAADVAAGDTAPLPAVPVPQAPTASSGDASNAAEAAEAEVEAAEAEVEAAEAEREATAAGDTSSLESVDAERLHILEALERGEIDVDEALATLDREETRRA